MIFPHTLPAFPFSANEYILSIHLHKSETRNYSLVHFFNKYLLGACHCSVNKSDKVSVSFTCSDTGRRQITNK